MEKRAGWLGVAVFLAAALTMGRVAGHDFLDWDDQLTIAGNPRLNPPTLDTLKYYWTHDQYGLFMPGTYTVWAGLAKVGWVDVPDERGYRTNPWVFHGASVLFHAIAAVVVFVLLTRLKLPDVAASMGALLYAVHPIQVESVAWASGMKDVLCGMFSLIALWQYIASVQSEQRRLRWMHFIAATLAFACALLCKPAAVMVPAMALVLDSVMLRRSLRSALLVTALWWPMALGWMWVARTVQPTHGLIGAPLHLRPLVTLDAIAFYLGKLLWPVNLAVDYGRTPAVSQDRGWLWWTWLVPAAVIALLVFKPRRPLIAAALLFVIAPLPVLGLVPFLFQYYTTVADHYLYLAMLGPALALAWVAATWDRTWLRASVGAALVVLALLSIRQAGIWHSNQTLFAHTMRVNPDSFLGHNNLGTATIREADRIRFTAQGQALYRQAAELFTRAIALRRKVNRGVDDYWAGYDNRALALEKLGELEPAVADRKQALRIALGLPPRVRPNVGDMAHKVARDLMALSRWEEAVKYLDVTLQANPRDESAAMEREHAQKMMGK